MVYGRDGRPRPLSTVVRVGVRRRTDTGLRVFLVSNCNLVSGGGNCGKLTVKQPPTSSASRSSSSVRPLTHRSLGRTLHRPLS